MRVRTDPRATRRLEDQDTLLFRKCSAGLLLFYQVLNRVHFTSWFYLVLSSSEQLKYSPTLSSRLSQSLLFCAPRALPPIPIIQRPPSLPFPAPSISSSLFCLSWSMYLPSLFLSPSFYVSLFLSLHFSFSLGRQSPDLASCSG